MKTVILTLIFGIVSFSGIIAQTEFAPLGAQWAYRSRSAGNSPNGHEWYKLFTCMNDSVDGVDRYLTIQAIDGRQEVYFNNFASQFQYSNRSYDTSLIYLKVNEDTVFYQNPVFEKYTPLFVFNLNIGDTLRIPITDTGVLTEGHLGKNIFTDPNGDSLITLIVDSIVHKNYNGTSLETFYMTTHVGLTWHNSFGPVATYPQFNWSVDIIDAFGQDTATMSGAYNKLWGGLGAGILPDQFGSQYVLDMKFRYDKICAYSDSSFSFGNINDCIQFAYNIPLSIKELNAAVHNLQIYPNPVNGSILNIKSEKLFPKDAKLWMFDVLGKEMNRPIFLDNKSDLQIDLTHFVKGTYLLVFQIGNEKYYHKIVRL